MFKIKGLTLLFSIFILPFYCDAQLGGMSSFSFLEMPTNPKLAGIGLHNVSSKGADATHFLANPALPDTSYAGFVSFNYIPFYAQIRGVQAGYVHALSDRLVLSASVFNLNYGEMDFTTSSGIQQGTFRANDYSVAVGAAYNFGVFNIGSNLRFSNASIDAYSASLLSYDMGALYKHPTRDFNIGLTVRNVGLISSRFDGAPINAPLNISLGMSYKLEHLPFRFSLTSHNWQRWDITYLDPVRQATININGQEVIPQKTFFDTFARHFVVGGEVLFSKNFNVRIGYNHLINREMRLENSTRWAGFNFGFMLRVKSFEVALSRATLSPTGATTFLGLVVNTQRLIGKKKVSISKS